MEIMTNEEWAELVREQQALIKRLDEETLALHRKLAAETLRADQGWTRYEEANRDRNALRLAAPQQHAQPLPKWIDDAKGRDPFTDDLIAYIEVHPVQQHAQAKPNADCSGDPSCCPDNEGYGCACTPVAPVAAAVQGDALSQQADGYQLSYDEKIAYQQGRAAGIEEAAKLCDRGIERMVTKQQRDGAARCAAAIRALGGEE